MIADIVVIAWDGWLSFVVSGVMVALIVWNVREARRYRRAYQEITEKQVVTATLDDGRHAVVLLADQKAAA